MKKMVCVVIIVLFSGSLAVSASGLGAGLYGGLGPDEGTTAAGVEIQIGADAYSNGWGLSFIGGLGYNFDYLLDFKLGLLAEFFWRQKIGINFLGTGVYGGLNFVTPMIGLTIPLRFGDLKVGLDAGYMFPSFLDLLLRDGGIRIGLFVHWSRLVTAEEFAYVSSAASGSSGSTGTGSFTLQNGVYKNFGTGPNGELDFLTIFKQVYFKIDGTNAAHGSYELNGNVLTIRFTSFYGNDDVRKIFQGKILVYTLINDRTFSGYGETWVSTHF
jgi:hypothetical protein